MDAEEITWQWRQNKLKINKCHRRRAAMADMTGPVQSPGSSRREFSFSVGILPISLVGRARENFKTWNEAGSGTAWHVSDHCSMDHALMVPLSSLEEDIPDQRNILSTNEKYVVNIDMSCVLSGYLHSTPLGKRTLHRYKFIE
jgi:hypothetical protein